MFAADLPLKDVQADFGIFRCPLPDCPAQFVSKAAWSSHVAYERRQYRHCSKCQWSFRGAKDWDDHLSTVTHCRPKRARRGEAAEGKGQHLPIIIAQPRASLAHAQ
jgi:hypothetical protein